MRNKVNELTAEQVIKLMDLKPLPIEGGHFKATYHADEEIPRSALPQRYSSPKSFGAAIIYLLSDDPDSFSELHRLPTDEIYHFYLGDPIELLQLHPDGFTVRTILGGDLLAGQKVQTVVPRGVWQGSHLVPGGRWGLLGTTMAPAYSDDDYFQGKREELIAQYPHEADLIRTLTRPKSEGGLARL